MYDLIWKKFETIIKKRIVLGLLTACAICSIISFFQKKGQEDGGTSGWRMAVGSFFSHQMEREFFQIPRYLEEGEGLSLTKTESLLGEQILLMKYLFMEEEPIENEDPLTAELIGQYEGTDEDFKNIDEESLDYNENALHIENSVLQEMERENNIHNTEQENNVSIDNENMEAADLDVPIEFQIPEYPAYSYDWSENWDYETLISNFYAVDKSTYLKEEYVGLKQLLEPDLSVDKKY